MLSSRLIFVLFVGILFVNSTNAYATNENNKVQEQSVTMLVSPNQCVAMTEGQTCYIDVEISWQSTTPRDVCLFNSIQKTPLKCWNQVIQGEYEYELVSNKDVVFLLRTIDNLTTLSQQEVNMAWVHKKRGKPTNWWRLF